MKTKLKNAMVLSGALCILPMLSAGCGIGAETAAKTEQTQVNTQSSEAPNDTSSEEHTQDTQEAPEAATGKWQVLDPKTAAAFDADFMGDVRKITEDSFFVAETKAQILDDGSLTTSSPSTNADISDSQLIPVAFDDQTYFYMRTIYGNGESHEDKEADFSDIEEHMEVEMKGSFENDVFYATEIRLIKIS